MNQCAFVKQHNKKFMPLMVPLLYTHHIGKPRYIGVQEITLKDEGRCGDQCQDLLGTRLKMIHYLLNHCIFMFLYYYYYYYYCVHTSTHPLFYYVYITDTEIIKIRNCNTWVLLYTLYVAVCYILPENYLVQYF